MRRPLGQRAQDIGVWAGILRAITMLSVLTNGWTIAASSEFIPHMVFKYFQSDDGKSMKGYVGWSLSVFDTNDFGWTDDNTTWLGPKEPGTEVGGLNQTECWYKGLNEEQSPYERKQIWWNVFAARLGFVLAFQVRLRHLNLRFVAVGFCYLPTNL